MFLATYRNNICSRVFLLYSIGSDSKFEPDDLLLKCSSVLQTVTSPLLDETYQHSQTSQLVNSQTCGHSYCKSESQCDQASLLT